MFVTFLSHMINSDEKAELKAIFSHRQVARVGG